MGYETIRYACDGGIATLTLDRPDVLNAMDSRMRAEVTSALGQAGAEARVVVLTGAGRAFCSGQDLGGMGDPTALDHAAILREEYEPMLRAVTGCPVPVIAAVNGIAAGAGANLALACDVVIAARSASFVQAFARIGLVPDAGGTWFLPRQVGLARALGAALFAEPVSADRAAQWGMIWEAVADEAFAEHWRARARHLAQGPTLAYGQMKTALRASATNDLEAQLAVEAAAQAICGRSRDFAEGVRAFAERRPARFEGR